MTNTSAAESTGRSNCRSYFRVGKRFTCRPRQSSQKLIHLSMLFFFFHEIRSRLEVLSTFGSTCRARLRGFCLIENWRMPILDFFLDSSPRECKTVVFKLFGTAPAAQFEVWKKFAAHLFKNLLLIWGDISPKFKKKIEKMNKGTRIFLRFMYCFSGSN